MKKLTLILLGVVFVAGTVAVPSAAHAQARPAALTTLQMESLADKRAELQGDVEFFRKKFNDASGKYAAAVKAGSAAESDYWNREVTNWDAQLKSAQAKLADMGTARPGRVELARPADTFRPVEETLPRISFKEAQAEIAKLEEFRAAEGALTRKGPRLETDPAARTNLRAAQAELARLDEAATAPRRIGATALEMQQDLDRLTVRKAQLESDVDRYGKDLADWETRYQTLKNELAKLETENKARTQLDAVRAELAGIDAEIQRTQAQLRAAQAEAFRPTIEDVPGRRVSPATAGQSEGTVRRKSVASQQTIRDLDRLADRKDALQREIDSLRAKLNYATRELTSAQKLSNQSDIDRWSKETSTLDSQLKAVQTELGRLEDEAQGKMRQMSATVLEPTAATPLADGDSLQIIVLEDETLNGLYQVKRGGYVVLPRVGRINLNGMDIPAAEKAIKENLESTQLRQATVTIERTRAAKEEAAPPLPQGTFTGDEGERQDIIYLSGEFINSGPLKIPPGEAPTLIKTILRSGGLTPQSDLTRVKLIRFESGRGTIEEINVHNILSGIGTPADWRLNTGDIIVVPAYAPVVYVEGNVVKPGVLRLFQDETITAYSAILRSGGFTRFANLKKVYVVRELGNGEKAKIPVNIKDVREGKVPDIILQMRDIVVVPESFWSL